MHFFDKYTKIQDYSTKNSANWTPTEDGYYKLYVDVKDEAGNVKTKAFDFIVGNVDDLEMEFTLSTKSGVVNTPVTIDATSEGGVNPITYKFYYKKDGTYTMIKDYSDSSSIEWTPEEEGTYAVYVAAKDASGKIVSKYINFTVGKGVEITDISLDKTTIKVGDSVNIKTTATGNSNLQYRVAVHDFENTWTTLHDFKSSNTTTWTPEIADKYVIWIDVIDEDGNYDSFEGNTSTLINSYPSTPRYFIEGKIKYNGMYYHEMHNYNRSFFEDTQIMVGEISFRNGYNKKEVLENFIRLNECGSTMNNDIIKNAKELMEEM